MNLVRHLVTWFAILVVVADRPLVVAHEGHQPLPTKGVLVDTKRGYLTLSAQARAAIGLETKEVRAGEVRASLVTYAETVAPWQAKAFGSAQVSGRITRLLVRPGDTVTKGQVIAELDSRELEAVRLDYLRAKNDAEYNRKLLDSTRPAARQGAVPQQRLDELENSLAQSSNDLEIARIRAATLGLDAEQFHADKQVEVRHLIRSPIAGKITHSDLSEGKFVEAFEHLFDIVNLDEVWVKIQILEKDIPHVSVGQSVELVLLDSTAPIQTKIDRVDMALDPQGQVCWAWATVSQANIMPGLVGSARIVTSVAPKRLAVPVSSVYSDGLQSYVFVEHASTKAGSEFRKRYVRPGKRTSPGGSSAGTHVEITQGEVYPGDRVVVKGGHELSSLFFLEVLKLSSQDRARLGIRTATAEIRPLTATLNLSATATLPPESRWMASSQLPGTIYSHNLSPGQKVAAGELLMEIASADFHALQLDLLRTWLDAKLIRQRADKLQQAGKDVFSGRALLEMLNQADQLELKADSLKRQLVSLGLQSSEVDDIVHQKQIRSLLPVRSPMNGYLVSWRGTLGETVLANQALAEIHNLENMWVEAQVPSQHTAMVAVNAAAGVSVLSNPSVNFTATVARLGPIVSPSTRMQLAWLVPNSQPATELSESFWLRDGMRLSVTLEAGERVTSLAVPQEAVLRDGLHTFVFVQKADNYLERRRITTGRTDGQWIEVRSGLSPADEVIVAGARELQTAYASLR